MVQATSAISTSLVIEVAPNGYPSKTGNVVPMVEVFWIMREDLCRAEVTTAPLIGFTTIATHRPSMS